MAEPAFNVRLARHWFAVDGIAAERSNATKKARPIGSLIARIFMRRGILGRHNTRSSKLSGGRLGANGQWP